MRIQVGRKSASSHVGIEEHTLPQLSPKSHQPLLHMLIQLALLIAVIINCFLLAVSLSVFVALETERLCKFVSLVMFGPGEHYSGALQAHSSSAYSSATDEG